MEPAKERTETTLPNLEEMKKEALAQSLNKSEPGLKVKQKASGKMDTAVIPAGSNFE
jgi:hypothetical protein